MLKLILLTAFLVTGNFAHAAVQVADLDWFVGQWGVSKSHGYTDGHMYAAEVNVDKISATELRGKIVIANELGQIASEQNFKIEDTNAGQVSLDLEYTGDPTTPGWWDGPIGPTGPKFFNADPAATNESLSCDKITNDGTFIDGNGKVVVQTYQVAFLNNKGLNVADVYPASMTFNVTPIQGRLTKPTMMMTLRWNKAGTKYYSLFEFNSPF